MKKTTTAMAFLATIAFSQAQNIVPQDSIFSQPSEIALNQESLTEIFEDTLPKKPIIPKNSSEALESSKIIERADSSFLRGEKDAKRYYVGYNLAANAVFVVTLFNPIFGLGTAIAFANIPPSHKNLGYPDDVLFKNPRYQNGYKHKAKQIKVKKVWTNFAAVLAIDLAMLLVVGYAMTH
jgi:hypothetical protein